ncbi:MAG: type II toxin-antitoxin system prevent-host-death family antitoxin [Blastocatellia bacterium]|nr:type II toxin-antitoxin system prevent-host-death family antitoxin [Blastocatellia bacterium]
MIEDQTMRSVNISDLKNNLSRYLSEVREGKELVIRDRNTPIAKLVPISPAEDADDEEKELEELAADGVIRLAQQELPDSFFSMPGPDIPIERAVAAVVADRDEN